jgi:acylglycerol lipase
MQSLAGAVAVWMGLGDLVIPVPHHWNVSRTCARRTFADVRNLSHNPAVSIQADRDPMMRLRGSVQGMRDMITMGNKLDTSKVWDQWPRDMPLLICHGTEDTTCDPDGSERFFRGISAEDKTLKMFHVGHPFLCSSSCSLSVQKQAEI